MDEDLVEFQREDFEFADAPMSKDFLMRIFKKYGLKHITYFGGDLFYAEMTDGEPLPALYGGIYYADDVEFVMDFMARERINSIRCEDGRLKRSIAEISDISDV